MPEYFLLGKNRKVSLNHMSQTKTVIKQVASGEYYQALIQASEAGDYDTICRSYVKITEHLEQGEKEILEKLQNLPRGIKEEDIRKLRTAFWLRAESTLPLWHNITLELKEHNITEGTVVGFGGKGDPLVKSTDGRIVFLNKAEVSEGDRVKFQITGESEKVSFGKIFEFTADSFYSVFTQDYRQKISDSLSLVNARLRALQDSSNGLSEVSDLLKELEEVKVLADKLQPEEKERIDSQVLSYRRRLLDRTCTKLMFDVISKEEEEEIGTYYQGDTQKVDEALSAPGLFRSDTFEDIKEQLFEGDEIRGYSDMLNQMEDKIDTMDSAMEVMQFKTKIEDAYPKAKRYLENMDNLFFGLMRRTKQVVTDLSNKNITESEQILTAIKDAFSPKVLAAELRRAFRSAEEFFSLRGAMVELKARFSKSSNEAENTIKPYLRQKLEQIFGRHKKTG